MVACLTKWWWADHSGGRGVSHKWDCFAQSISGWGSFTWQKPLSSSDIAPDPHKASHQWLKGTAFGWYSFFKDNFSQDWSYLWKFGHIWAHIGKDWSRCERAEAWVQSHLVQVRGERTLFSRLNTNTNTIRVQKFGRIRIQILFGIPPLSEYEYEYLDYSNNTEYEYE